MLKLSTKVSKERQVVDLFVDTNRWLIVSYNVQHTTITSGKHRETLTRLLRHIMQLIDNWATDCLSDNHQGPYSKLEHFFCIRFCFRASVLNIMVLFFFIDLQFDRSLNIQTKIFSFVFLLFSGSVNWVMEYLT